MCDFRLMSAGVVVQNAVMAPADELRRQIRAWALRSGIDLLVVAQVRTALTLIRIPSTW